MSDVYKGNKFAGAVIINYLFCETEEEGNEEEEEWFLVLVEKSDINYSITRQRQTVEFV